MRKIVIVFTILFINFSMILLSKDQVLASSSPYEYLSVSLPNQNIKDVKYQFRGAWIKTLNNRDIASQKGMNAEDIEQFKAEFIDMLDLLDDNHINALIFQVKPLLDAFYDSELNPWSQYMYQEDVHPGWDPLEWMTSEAFKRKIEFHAWINTFQVSNEIVTETRTKSDILNSLSSNNFAKKNPNYVVVGNDQLLYLNPSQPKVQNYLINTVTELINNYSINAIHINDTFYPSQGLDSSYDQELFDNSDSYSNIDHFRKESVTNLLRTISNKINTYNIQNQKCVQLGIAFDPTDAQYLDIASMINHSYIDYLIPKINVLTIEDYKTELLKWINLVEATKVNLYVGQNFEITSVSNLINHLIVNEQYDAIKGTSLDQLLNFSKNDFNGHTKLKNEVWNKTVLLPNVQTIGSQGLSNITGMTINAFDSKIQLSWHKIENAKYYVIYRFTNDEKVVLDSLDNMIAIVTHEQELNRIVYNDIDVQEGNIYRYFISSVDYANYESLPTSQGINLTVDTNLSLQITIFVIISFIGIIAIGYSSIKVLKS